ncbi:MAG: sensor histidine kinase [Actinomycetota bacterium]
MLPDVNRGMSRKPLVAIMVLLALCLSFYAYVYAEKRIDRANDSRHLSFEHADALRHSSDDLTRMVRTYVVTGDPVYRQAYQDIIDIREGRMLAPEGYDAAYWDVALAGGEAPRLEQGAGIPLMEQVRQAGVTAEELAQLTEAKAHSDALTTRELEAMHLAETGGEAGRAQAVSMLHDATYHRAKAAIMGPINRFYQLMDARTLAEVHEAERTAVVFRLIFVAFTLAAALLLWRTHRELRAILGGTAAQVHAAITRIGRGELGAPVTARPVPPGSVLDGLDEMLGKLRDIEAARRRAADELGRKNDALARSNAELEAFAYVASHDLREPLRNVTSFSTLLARRLEGRLSEEEHELLKIVTDAAMRMDSLVRDLLEVSRVGRTDQEFHPVPIAEVVGQALDSLRIQIQGADAVVEVPADLPVVVGNAEELYRVFMNLVGNALKYRRTARPVIKIRCLPENGTGWRFEIEDNGIGIENGQGYEERIFRLFQRLHQRDEHGGGTGIGLPICRKIVNRHGGQIWAQSPGPGLGTTIVFTLPRT